MGGRTVVQDASRCWGHIQDTPVSWFAHHQLSSSAPLSCLLARRLPVMWRAVPLDPGQPAHGSLAPQALRYSSQPGGMETAGPCSLSSCGSALLPLANCREETYPEGCHSNLQPLGWPILGASCTLKSWPGWLGVPPNRVKGPWRRRGTWPGGLGLLLGYSFQSLKQRWQVSCELVATSCLLPGQTLLVN